MGEAGVILLFIGPMFILFNWGQERNIGTY